MLTSRNRNWINLLTGYILFLKICKKTRQDVRRGCLGCDTSGCFLRSMLCQWLSYAKLKQLVSFQWHLNGNFAIIKIDTFNEIVMSLSIKSQALFTWGLFPSLQSNETGKHPVWLLEFNAQALTGCYPLSAFTFAVKDGLHSSPLPHHEHTSLDNGQHLSPYQRKGCEYRRWGPGAGWAASCIQEEWAASVLACKPPSESFPPLRAIP